MKRFLIYSISAVLLCCSCTKIETIVNIVDVEVPVPVDPLAYYNYDSKDYSIHTLQYQMIDEYTAFLIAREPESPFGNCIVLYILEKHLGKTLDFTDITLDNRIDYIVYFEDANHLYAPIYKPQSGTLNITKGKRNGEYSIDLNVQWNDKKPLTFKYSGLFEPGEIE